MEVRGDCRYFFLRFFVAALKSCRALELGQNGHLVAASDLRFSPTSGEIVVCDQDIASNSFGLLNDFVKWKSGCGPHNPFLDDMEFIVLS